MKKIKYLLLLASPLLFVTGCSDSNSTSTSSATTASAETVKNQESSEMQKEKEEEAKKLADEKAKQEEEREKQEELAKKTSDAENAVTLAETELTWESYTSAKSAIEAIPNGNESLTERLQAVANTITINEEQVAQAEEEPTTLTDFVNKYGMSPVAYKVQYYGMTEEEALRDTPDHMKSSGEMQLGYVVYGIE